MNDDIASHMHASQLLVAHMLEDKALQANIVHAVNTCVACLRAGGKILFAGNGGSAADAQHMAAEFVGRYAFDRPALAAVALTTDTSILTAVANDYGYDNVFARQLQALGNRGDVFVGYSTSGQSRNILLAFEVARDRGLSCIGFTGSGGASMASLCDVLIAVPSTETPNIQEGHLIIGHILCALIEKNLFAPKQ